MCFTCISMCNASSVALLSQMSALDASFEHPPVHHVCVYLWVHVYVGVCVRVCYVCSSHTARCGYRRTNASRLASQSSPYRVF